MRIQPACLQTSAALCALLLGFSSISVQAADRTVRAGETVNSKVKLSGTDTLTIESGGTLSVYGEQAVELDGAATGVVINNAGKIQNIESNERAIETSKRATARTYTLTNQEGGQIISENDGFKINVDITSGAVTIDNQGLISSTGGGQAIDFGDLESGAIAVVINNYATGVIRSADADGVRPGENAVVTNSGRIEAGSTGDGGNDGVDLRSANTSKIVNETGGTIRGAKQGVNGGSDKKGQVLVENKKLASIIGRNGSGVGSDNTGKVINHGTIQGNFTPALGSNGDGDGVDIDYLAEIENFGVIEGTGAGGVDSGGQPNNAEGVPVGGGTIRNHKGARITGAARGILIDNGSGGPGHYATHLTNHGLIEGQTQYGVKFVGPFDDTIVNGGTISGANGQAVLMGDGNDTFTLLAGGKVEGYVDAEGGTDTFILGKQEEEQLPDTNASFDMSRFKQNETWRNFENFEVAGNWGLTGETDFAGNMHIREGANSLYDAKTPNMHVTQTGGTLTGDGTISSLDQQAGIFAPGGGLGAFTIADTYVQGPQGTLRIDIGDGGSLSLVRISGSAQFKGGSLDVRTHGTPLPDYSEYVIAETQQGTLSGHFGRVTVDQPTYKAGYRFEGNTLVLTLTRTNTTLSSLADHAR